MFLKQMNLSKKQYTIFNLYYIVTNYGYVANSLIEN